MRLIDADELIKGFDMCIDTADDTASVLIASTFKRIVNKQPTIEPERKKGKWIDRGKDKVLRWECPECGRRDKYIYNYCPDCGLDMREGEADD